MMIQQILTTWNRTVERMAYVSVSQWAFTMLKRISRCKTEYK